MVENESEMFAELRAKCDEYIKGSDEKSAEAADELKPLLFRTGGK